MNLLLVSGMSGSGKSTAFNFLEDMGYNCVDNLPVPLLKTFADFIKTKEDDTKVCVGIDIRCGKNLPLLETMLNSLEENGNKCDILFLDASDSVIVKRFKETRRSHPLAKNDRIYDGIREEREKMSFLKKKADFIIDTSHLLTRELNDELKKIFLSKESYKSINIMLLSFGFKYGLPEDADLVFDVRFLPNPYYDLSLRHLTGNDKPIQDFVLKYDEATEFLDRIESLFRFLIPKYINEGKNSLVIAIGCTGGKHRSVTLTNELYKRLSVNSKSYGLKVVHRDINTDRKIIN